MTSRDFDLAMRKGAIGERIARQHLEAEGWIVYTPATDGPHAFDMLGIKDKKRAVALDVKAKARMNRYPATGINQSHFEEYQRFSEKHNMPFWIVFVDEHERRVYGNTLAELEKERVVRNRRYPYEMALSTRLRLWPLEAMIGFAVLDDAACAELVETSQRNHEYAC